MSLKSIGLALLFLIGLDDFIPAFALMAIPHERVVPPEPHPEPLQGEVPPGRQPWGVKRYWTAFVLHPRASYDISARVVDRDLYRLGATNALMPWDLVLTWGRLVDEPYRSEIHYVHTHRFFNWGTSDASLDMSYIAGHAANTHLIADNWRVAAALARVRSGDLVRLEGDLVDITGPDGFDWKTSLSRTDSGAGACETMYVRIVTIGERRYR
jgi:hypothetical protein